MNREQTRAHAADLLQSALVAIDDGDLRGARTLVLAVLVELGDPVAIDDDDERKPR